MGYNSINRINILTLLDYLVLVHYFIFACFPLVALISSHIFCLLKTNLIMLTSRYINFKYSINLSRNNCKQKYY